MKNFIDGLQKHGRIFRHDVGWIILVMKKKGNTCGHINKIKNRIFIRVGFKLLSLKGLYKADVYIILKDFKKQDQ